MSALSGIASGIRTTIAILLILVTGFWGLVITFFTIPMIGLLLILATVGAAYVGRFVDMRRAN